MDTRREAYLDSMLRYLGATYYQSLHGEATSADVAAALRSVRDGRHGEPGDHGAGVGEQARRPVAHRGRWRYRVRDVMTTSVVTVDRSTPFKEVTDLLTTRKISGVPVLGMGRRVIGVVSEGDLLRLQEPAARRYRVGSGRSRRARKVRLGRNAGELMTAPAITIHPDATVGAAARLMNDRHIRRLPVVSPDGTLIGIVSRRDLLAVFLRPDSEIADEARGAVRALLGEPSDVTVTVRSGVAFLEGHCAQPDLVSDAVGVVADIDGVVTVIDKITAPQGNALS